MLAVNPVLASLHLDNPLSQIRIEKYISEAEKQTLTGLRHKSFY